MIVSPLQHQVYLAVHPKFHLHPHYTLKFHYHQHQNLNSYKNAWKYAVIVNHLEVSLIVLSSKYLEASKVHNQCCTYSPFTTWCAYTYIFSVPRSYSHSLKPSNDLSASLGCPLLEQYDYILYFHHIIYLHLSLSCPTTSWDWLTVSSARCWHVILIKIKIRYIWIFYWYFYAIIKQCDALCLLMMLDTVSSSSLVWKYTKVQL